MTPAVLTLLILFAGLAQCCTQVLLKGVVTVTSPQTTSTENILLVSVNSYDTDGKMTTAKAEIDVDKGTGTKDSKAIYVDYSPSLYAQTGFSLTRQATSVTVLDENGQSVAVVPLPSTDTTQPLVWWVSRKLARVYINFRDNSNNYRVVISPFTNSTRPFVFVEAGTAMVPSSFLIGAESKTEAQVYDDSEIVVLRPNPGMCGTLGTAFKFTTQLVNITTMPWGTPDARREVVYRIESLGQSTSYRLAIQSYTFQARDGTWADTKYLTIPTSIMPNNATVKGGSESVAASLVLFSLLAVTLIV